MDNADKEALNKCIDLYIAPFIEPYSGDEVLKMVKELVKNFDRAEFERLWEKNERISSQ